MGQNLTGNSLNENKVHKYLFHSAIQNISQRKRKPFFIRKISNFVGYDGVVFCLAYFRDDITENSLTDNFY